MNRLWLVSAMGIITLCASTAKGVLVNQYTFNNGTAIDSTASAAHGTIPDPLGISKFVGGQLDLRANNGVLSNNVANGAYVNLPNGIVTSALQAGQPNAASFEMWVTIQENRFWARLFDFGSSDGGEDNPTAAPGQDYIMMVPLGFTGTLGLETHAVTPPASNGVLLGANPLSTGRKQHVVVTLDQNNTTAGPGGTANVYVNNVLAITGPINPELLPGQLEFENNDWLGRSQYGGDPLIDALYDEFRIYDHALSPLEVGMNFTAGPVEAPFPTLVVNRDTGVVTIANQTAASKQLASYSITSAAGGLKITGGWDPIAPASGWTIQTQTVTEIAETGGTAQNISVGGSINIGNAWTKSKFEDLEFSFLLSGGSTMAGEVEFIGNGGEFFGRSDLNASGEVDVADWILFLDGNGDNLSGLSEVAQALKGDLNGDNFNNHVDFLLFRQDFVDAQGLQAFEALFANVPEPSAFALAAFGVLVTASARSKSRT
jgi:hypothetical protein